MGSGSTAVAAVRTDRHHVGYDLDPEYVARAEARIAAEVERLGAIDVDQLSLFKVTLPAVKVKDQPEPEPGDYQSRAVREGRQAKEIAEALLKDCGFDIKGHDVGMPGGVEVNIVAADANGTDWAFDVSGAFTSNRAGLKRTDTLWKALGKASVLSVDPTFDMPVVLLTTDKPAKGSAGAKALAASTGWHPGRERRRPVAAVVEMLDAQGRAELTRYAAEGRIALPHLPD